MGVLKIKKKTWNEEDIQITLSRYFMSQSNIKYIAENLYIYTWESDLWIMTKSDITYEFEIKISKADFKNDFKHKTEKHALLENKNNHLIKPNYFYYAVPENLIKVEDVPEYAGLIYLTDIYPYFEIVKQAPKLTDSKHNEKELNLLEKFYYNYRDWRRKTLNERIYSQELNKLIDDYSEKPEKEKKHYTKLLEENKKNKITAETEGERADRYMKLYSEVNDELRKTNRVVHRLVDVLKNNNIDIDYFELWKDVD